MFKSWKNWKTTVGGLLLTVGTALAASTGISHAIGLILQGAGGLIIGLGAQDAS